MTTLPIILALLLAVQAVLLLGYISSCFPMPIMPGLIMPVQHFSAPQVRDVLLYRSFIFIFLGLYVGSLFMKKYRLFVFKDLNKLVFVVVLESVITILLVAAFVQKTLFGSSPYNPALASNAFIILGMVALVIKPAWGYADFFVRTLKTCRLRWSKGVGVQRWFDLALVLLIIALISVPDLESLVGRVLLCQAQDQNNIFLIAPGWAYRMGCVLNIDVLSWYGIGAPIFLSDLGRIFGGFTYANMMKIVLLLIAVYFVLWYFLLKRWLRHAVLAAAAVLLMINWRMFGPEGSPVTLFASINATPVRYFFDVIFFWFIYLHLNKHTPWAVLAAGVTGGTALFYNTSAGMCLAVVLAVYVSTLFFIWPPDHRRWWVLSVMAVPFTFVALTLLYVGKYCFSSVYWQAFSTQFNYWGQGLWQLPFSTVLLADWKVFSIAILLLIFYLISIAVAGRLIFWERQGSERITYIVLLAVYGILDYQHFLMVATGTVLVRNITIPLVLLALWTQDWLKSCSTLSRGWLYVGVFSFGIFCLVNNHHFIAYPNVLNLSRNPNTDPLVQDFLPGRRYMNSSALKYPDRFKLAFNSLGEVNEDLRQEKDFSSDAELRDYVRKELDFREDARLIQSLTSSNDQVPVISSQEILILMQAVRKPFFYIFPLIESAPMRQRSFPMSFLFTQEHLDKVISQLDEKRPEFVFVQKILLSSTYPPEYVGTYYGLLALMDAVKARYAVYMEGKFLIAMKRRP